MGATEGAVGKSLCESPVELEAGTWRQGLRSAGLVLELLMVVMCSWGAWHTDVQHLLFSVDRTLSAQCLPLGQPLHEFRNNCIIADPPMPLLACTETLGTTVNVTM